MNLQEVTNRILDILGGEEFLFIVEANEKLPKLELSPEDQTLFFSSLCEEFEADLNRNVFDALMRSRDMDITDLASQILDET